MNSTYLESVDKWFAWKGVISIVAVSILIIFVGGLGSIALEWTLQGLGVKPPSAAPGFLLANGIAMAVVVSILGWGALWLLRKESFAFTHYPVRFNRKTRMVHVFRTNGTVLSVPWDQVFFTLGYMAQWNEWEIRGHVLEPDNVTIKETFALSYVGSLSAIDSDPNHTQLSADDFVRGHWEFIRRYMEDGPQAVLSQVQFCMPVHARRERFRVSMERMFANIAGAPFPIYWTMFPLCLVASVFRSIAMRTCRIPQWPAGVDAACAIELDDPFAIEGAPNGDRTAVFPDAARAAGVCFVAPPPNSVGTQKRVGASSGVENRTGRLMSPKVNNKRKK